MAGAKEALTTEIAGILADLTTQDSATKAQKWADAIEHYVESLKVTGAITGTDSISGPVGGSIVQSTTRLV